MHWCVDSATPHKTLLFGLVYDIQLPVRGSTLDATIKLLCAVVRGIIQRKDPFVFTLQVNDDQVSRLVELEDIAKNKCAVTRTERKVERFNPVSGMDGTVTYTVLELRPHCEYP